jgi:hypothetical protein
MYKSISLKGQSVEIDGKRVIELGYNTYACLISANDLIFVLDDCLAPNENFKCYGFDGKLKWTIEPGNWPEKHDCPVTGIWMENNNLFVYRRCGFEQQIELSKG